MYYFIVCDLIFRDTNIQLLFISQAIFMNNNIFFKGYSVYGPKAKSL